MRHHHFLTTVLAMGLLAGCSISAGESADYATRQEQRQNLREVVFQIPYVDPADLPTTGSINYRGSYGINLAPNRSAEGLMDLTANFRASTVSGEVTDFVDQNNLSLTGSLVIDEGAIDRTVDPIQGFTYRAPITGTLNDGQSDFVVDGTLLGDFSGPRENFAEGITTGTVTTDGTTVSVGTEVWVAQRN